jgi:hypothetical protein
MINRIGLYAEIIFWRLLRKSRVFNYWYGKFLTELLFDFELLDMVGDEIKEKYYNKLKKLRNNTK